MTNKLRLVLPVLVMIISGLMTGPALSAPPVVIFDTDFALPAIRKGSGPEIPVCVDGASGLIVAGCDGAVGPQGTQGIQGIQGIQGLTGDNGEVRTPISSIPFTISESGSYYLTQNLNMPSSFSDGIAVLADDVTIDMMGFTMEGTTTSKNGINLDAQNNVVIYNGTIINFPRAAIYQNSATPGNHAFVKNVRVVENGYTPDIPDAYPAISLTGSDNVVSAVYAFNNTADGIRVGPTSVVKDSTSTNNGKDGITVGISSSALNNIVANNQEWGLIGGWGSAIIGNTVYSNNQGQATDRGGLRVFRGSQVENNTVYNNYQSGLHVFSHMNVLRNNHVTNTRQVGSGVYYCFYFSSSINVAIGNTASGCGIEFGGNVPPATRFVDNFGW